MIVELRTKHGALCRMSIWTFLFLYLKPVDLPILHRKDFKLLVDGKLIKKPNLFKE